MKKIIKDHPLTAFRKMNEARQKIVKKSLPKAQVGKTTPFQDYMKIPGAVASDTLARPYDDRFVYPSIPKNPKNQPTLQKAFEKTYGMDYKNEIGTPATDETVEQYRRRMGSTYKKGGSVKMKHGGTTKTKKKK